MNSKTSADPTLDWLYGLRGPSLKWDIDTARAFSARLGHPHRGYPCVHVAGTNGKGSVAAMLHEMICVAGLTGGLFTSPHLVAPEERIRIGRSDIDGALFRELIARLREEARSGLAAGDLPRHPSFFEMMTAAAMIGFAERQVDLAVFETGLGGRLDATNVIHPALAVITTISRDHTKTLGDTLAEIAKEKSGIIKPGIPVLAGWIDDGPRDEIREAAYGICAPFYDARREITLVEHGDGTFDVETPETHHSRLTCCLPGRHQMRNAALAIRAAELLRGRGLPIPPQAMRPALAEVRWPGRLETVSGSPPVLLDAAHNNEGIAALAAHLAADYARDDGTLPRVLLFGLTDGRDPVGMLTPLRDLFDKVIVTRADTPRARDPREICSLLASRSIAAEAIDSVEEALERSLAAATPEGLVVVAGSLYLVGDARRTLLDLSGPGHPRREMVPDMITKRPQKT